MGQGWRRWGLLGCGPWCRQSRQGQSKGSAARKQGLHESLSATEIPVPARIMKKPAKSAELSAEANLWVRWGRIQRPMSGPRGGAVANGNVCPICRWARSSCFCQRFHLLHGGRFDLANALCAHAIQQPISCSVMPPEPSSFTLSQRSSTMRRLRSSSPARRWRCHQKPARHAGATQ